MFMVDALRVLAAAAVVASPSPSPSAPPEITRVVTSDRTDETLRNTTRTTYVITAAQLAAHGDRTIGSALARVPGIEIENYGPIGATVSYGLRGSSSAQVLVMIDGVPAPGTFANSVQFGTISTTGVRRIEIVEGGGSTLYGTGAIGGIINVITDGTTPFSAAFRSGSFGDEQLRVQDGGVSFERIVAKNGYDQHPNGDYEATTARYGATRRIGKLDIAVHADAQSDRLGAPGPYPSFSTTSRESDVNELASVALTWHGAQSLPTLSLAVSRQQIAFGCSATDPNCFFATTAISTEGRSDVSFRNTVTASSSRTIYGVDLSRGVVRGDDGQGDIAIDALAQSAAYVQENWSLHAGDVYAGVRGERDGALGGEFSPSAGYRVELGNGLVVKVNAARAFRAPNASELYFPNYGNPALAPERATTGDFTLTDTHLLGGVSVGWFTNYTKNLIIANPNDNFAPENVAQARMQGLTLEARTLPSHGVTATLSVTDLYRAQDLYLQSRLPNDAVFSTALGLDVAPHAQGAFGGAGIDIRSVGARAAFSDSQPAFYQALPYTSIDAYTRWRVAPRVSLALRGYNLGNERYADVPGYPLPGRSFAFELIAK